MKKIFTEIKENRNIVKDYKIVVTKDIIEFKLIPKEKYGNDVTWLVINDKAGRQQLLMSMQRAIYDYLNR